ncbi:MAG: NUDIX hydrolase [Streptosporangiaceae bacterium]|jgi:8-oxo-dGTP pyrophosphatase MutT (NUDIX family)
MAEGGDRAGQPGQTEIRFPGQLADQAREIMAGARPPVTPRDAATVMLLRAAGPPPGRLEVYMLRRQSSMAFAPGAQVFPGGAVDPRDADEEVAWAGPDTPAWGRIFDAPPELARALVCAAVRETFEESGVLLAGPDAGAVVADTTSDDWEADRTALLDRSLSLAELLGRRRLVLRSDLLRPWSRWITPAVEKRRYDTRFFAAALPPGQRTRDVGGEAASVTWISPAAALAAGRRIEIQVWPPTAVTLAELAACGDVETALAGPREVAPRIPEVLIREGAAWLTVPGIQEYPL